MLISVVSPVYNCSQSLDDLCRRIKDTIYQLQLNYEIILIDDYSRDDSWERMERLAETDNRIKIIKLSRNFGQHAAISAGLRYAKGDYIVILDCDLQDQPEEIIKLYSKAEEGYDVVLGRRDHRKDALYKILLSRAFYKMMSILTNVKYEAEVANYGIYKKKVITAVNNMGDAVRYIPAMVQWVGFKRTSISIKHSERLHGKSSYSIFKLIELAYGVAIGFSNKPLKAMMYYGLFVTLLSAVVALYVGIIYLFGNVRVSGWASLVVSLWFLSGNVIMVLGVVGLYVGNIFEKVKGRQNYIVDSMINIQSHD